VVFFDAVKEALVIAKDAHTLEVVRERLAFALDKLGAAEKELLSLKEENTELLRENRELHKQLDSLAV
jgi:cell division protein FtsB